MKLSRDAKTILDLQRTVGNQFVNRLVEGEEQHSVVPAAEEMVPEVVPDAPPVVVEAEVVEVLPATQHHGYRRVTSARIIT
jgi:hypothetical protein